MKRIEHAKFNIPKDYKSLDEHSLILHAKRNSTSQNLVILVHGLTGHRYKYWNKLPQFLMEDLPDTDIGLYQYRTAWRRFGLFKSIDLESEARVLADQMRRLHRYKAIALVGHSMGGLLAKAAVSSLIGRNFEHHLKRVCCLVLLATPQLGSLRVPSWAKWLFRDGRALIPHNKLIQAIDTAFSTKLNLDRSLDPTGKYTIPAWAVIGAEDFWVDTLSAGIGIPEGQKHTIRASHGTVKSPSEKSDEAYAIIREALDATFKPKSPNAIATEDILEEEASAAHVPKIREIAVTYFGEDVTPEAVLQDFADHGDMLWVVKNIISTADEERLRIVGYMCMIPMLESAYRDVVSGKLKGAELTTEHVPPRDEQPFAIYIGAVAAKDFHSRAVVVHALKAQIDQAQRRGVTYFLTRPLTEDGLRLCERHRFMPLNGKRGMGQLYQHTPRPPGPGLSRT